MFHFAYFLVNTKAFQSVNTSRRVCLLVPYDICRFSLTLSLPDQKYIIPRKQWKTANNVENSGKQPIPQVTLYHIPQL